MNNLRALLMGVVLLAAPGCRGTLDSRSDELEAPAFQNDPVSLKEGNACMIREIRFEDASSKSWIAPQALEEVLTHQAHAVFGPPESAEDAWILEVRVALVDTQNPDEGPRHAGVVGFLRQPGQTDGILLEASHILEFTASDSRGPEELQGEVDLLLERMIHNLKAQCLLVMGSDDSQEEWLSHSEWQVRRRGAFEAGERNLAVLTVPLLDLLNDPQREVILAAIGALTRISREDRVVEGLMGLVHGTQEGIPRAVVNALADIRTPLALRYLESLAIGHPQDTIRDLARQWLSTSTGE